MTINNLTPGFLSFCPFINNKTYLLKLYLLYLFIKTITKKCQPCWFIILWQNYGVIFSSMEGENGVNLRTGKHIVHRKLARMKWKDLPRLVLALSLPTQFFAVQVYTPSFWTFEIFSKLWSHIFFPLHGVQVIVGMGYPSTLQSSDTLFSLPT